MGSPDEPTRQTIRFARSEARTVAWAAVGTGPPLVVGGWWMGHLELNWADPGFRDFVTGLAAHHTVVRYDRPGAGLSPGPPERSLDGEVAVLAQVVDALGGGLVTLLGGSAAGPVAAALAARRPELVERLLLYGTYADGARVAPPAVREQLVALVGAHWGLGSRVLADLFLPGATAEERDEFARYQRTSASADAAAASLAATYAFDVRSELGRITAPTLVVHRRDDRAIAFDLGREVAAAIPDATFVALEGHDHLPWRGDAAAVLRSLSDFLPGSSGPAPAATPASVLSARELEVLRLVAQGLADREIARRLDLSPHTVHRHLANIRTKLGLPSRAAATAYAARHHLLG
ncbi:LuxR family transcriptional regulator [Actinomycetospora sp. NBRC 106375]|uniref:alpha/beta fold hydrolase n=1 Tax=Actinomycetospora sp. NBRC 106375 TaxID=3032207 RepID=UPI0024A1FB5B|nr:alpha/beta fold hydrolase [Actinomycetospora sp. NBRC 106375]GLZ46006.1 LuxR family transcriptional regulator [Actinomycetospora sp. NBRC 106375]